MKFLLILSIFFTLNASASSDDWEIIEFVDQYHASRSLTKDCSKFFDHRVAYYPDGDASYIPVIITWADFEVCGWYTPTEWGWPDGHDIWGKWRQRNACTNYHTNYTYWESQAAPYSSDLGRFFL